VRRVSCLAVCGVALLVAIAGARGLDVAPSGQAPAPAAPPQPDQPVGRGQGGGRGRGAAPAPGGGGFGRGRSFDAEAIARAKPVFEEQCGFCHGNDARGRAGGPDLARSLVVLADTGGKDLSPYIRGGRPDRGMPAFPGLTDQQLTDIAEFLHERLEAARSRTATDTMASLVGDAKAGAAYFNGPGRCTTCHSITGDLAGIGAKYDPATLQGRIVNPRPGPGAGRGQATLPSPRSMRRVTVTVENGQTFSGTLDFRAKSGTAAATTVGATPPNDGFFDNTATYLGGVAPASAGGGNIPWYSGWTTP